MGLGDMLRKLFTAGAGAAAAEGEPVAYKSYEIVPTPRQHGGQYLTAGTIRKAFADGVRTHAFIRADTHGSIDDAKAFAVAKGRQIIDEMGDRMFDARP